MESAVKKWRQLGGITLGQSQIKSSYAGFGNFYLVCLHVVVSLGGWISIPEFSQYTLLHRQKSVSPDTSPVNLRVWVCAC